MAKKQYFLLIDTETTIKDTVADFGALICDRKGEIYTECAVLVNGHYSKHELFYNKDAVDIWSKQGLKIRKEKYEKMLSSGTRMLASVPAINRWLGKALAQYDPELTAYNLAFDLDKCERTKIDLSIFNNRFCLWQAASGIYGHRRDYKRYIIENHFFNTPTELQNMSYKTNAEVMCGFITGQYSKEPHTAIEDAKFYELPILKAIVKIKKWREKAKAYNWKSYQVKDHFQPSTSKNRKGDLI